VKKKMPSSNVAIHKKNPAYKTAWHYCLVVLILIGLLPQPLYANDLIYYFDLAQKNDAEFQAALQAYDASREIKKQALAGLLPVISANGEQKQTTQKILASDNVLFTVGESDFDTTSLSLTLSQPIINFSSIVRLDQASAETKVADAELEAAKQDLIIRLAEAYFNSLSALDITQTVQAEETAVEQLHELTSGRFNSGMGRVTDLYDAKARLALVQSNLIEAQNLKEDSFEALKELCNVDVSEVAKLKDETSFSKPEPDQVDDWVKNALGSNIKLLILKHKVEVAEQEFVKQRTGHLPTVDLIGRYENQITSGTLFGSGNETETNEVMLRLSMPIFQGGYVVSRTREAKSLYRQTIKAQERQKRAVIRETRAAFLGIKSSLNRIEALQQAQTSQEIALSAKKEGYSSGLYTSLDVLDAERLLYEAIRDYLQARYDYILNSLKLKQAVGSLNEKDIAAINNWFEKKNNYSIRSIPEEGG
jgi:outer membrane protein